MNFTEGVAADIKAIRGKFDQAVALAGLTPGSFCVTRLQTDANLAERLKNGRITAKRMAEVNAKLDEFLKREKEKK